MVNLRAKMRALLLVAVLFGVASVACGEPEAATPSPEPTPTEAARIRQFIEWLASNWSSTDKDINTLWEEARVIEAVESIPSKLLYKNAQEMEGRSYSFLLDLYRMKNQNTETLANTNFRSYVESIITYWEAYESYLEARRIYLGGPYPILDGVSTWGNEGPGHLALVEHRLTVRDNAYIEYLGARCDLWRQQRYSNADEVCAQVDR